MDNFGETIQLGIVLSCVLVMGLLTILAVWYSRKRNKANAEQALALGFKLQSRPDKNFRRRIEHLYRLSNKVQVANVAFRRMGETEVYLCDISVSGREADSGETEYRSVCVISPRLNLPFFMLVYQFEQVYALAGKLITPLLEKMIEWRGLQSISFEDAPLFNKKYQIFSNDEAKIRSIFSDTVLAKLSNTQEWIIRGEGDIFTFNRYEIRRGKPLTQVDINEQVNLAQQFLDWITY
ncbi:MAG: hypothetical protein LWX83_09440 [Anaerolineae bacterium]|nr:hypothetical protein [Anaerolineae bacterium]